MTGRVSGTRTIVMSLIGFLIIFIVQIVAYFLTNLLVLLAESFMGLGEILISVFLLLSVWWSRKPADEVYMFGRGRAQNVAALVSATIIIFFMSIETFREAIPRLFQNGASEFQNTSLALAVMGVAIIVSAIPLVSILREKAKDAAVKAQLIGLIIELGGGVAALIGIAFVAIGYPLADPLASIIVATAMLLSGIYLFKDNVPYLVGKAPSGQFLEKVESTVKSARGVLGIHDLKAEYVGPNIVHTGFHIEVAKDTLIEEASRIAHEVNEKVEQATGCQHCVIHVDPVK